MAETQLIKPADLLIDEENARISQPNTGQHKSIQALAQHLGTKLQVLAADIVGHGLDPSNLPIVMLLAGSAGRYTVLEGNRRLAALRALENPESVAEAVPVGVLKRIRALSRDYQNNPVESIPCVVFTNRESARHWIELRHTGLNDGAGLFPWGSDEIARWNARIGKPTEAHTQALDFLQRRGDLTPELRRDVPATSFKRLIETPDVRSKLGIEVLKGTLYLLADEKRVAKALMHIVNDLAAGNIKVGDIYKKKQRLKYANDLPADVVVAPTVKSGHGVPASTGGSLATTKPSAATARSAKKRDKLIPRDCVLNIADARVREIEFELRKLSLEGYPNAVSVLFRVFIELSVDFYIHKATLAASENDGLTKKLRVTVEDLITRKKMTPHQAKPVRRALQHDSFLAPSLTLMHQYVHNQNVFPAPSDLRAHWDSLQTFIAAMWTP